MSEGQMRLTLLVEAIDRLSAPFRRMSAAVQGPAMAAKRAFGGLNAGLESLSGRLEGLAALAGGGIEVKEVIGDEDAFNRLRIQYGMTKEAAEGLEHGLMRVGAAAGAPLAEMMASLKGFQAAGGDVARFADKLKMVGATVSLLGGQGAEVGQMLEVMQRNFDITGPTKMAQAMAAIYEQSLKLPGGFAGMTRAMDETGVQYAQLGHTGLKAMRELGAVYSIFVEGTGDSNTAYGSMQQFLGILGAPGKTRSGLLELINDRNGKDYTGARIGLSLPEIMQRLAKVYAQGPAGQRRIMDTLGPAMARYLSKYFAEAAQYGYSPTLNAKMAIRGDPTRFFNDASQSARSLSAQLSALHDQLALIGDQVLTGPIKWLAGVLSTFPRLTALAVTGLGGFLILGMIGPKIMATTRFIIGMLEAVRDFTIALRAGYGAMAAFNLVLAVNPVGAVFAGLVALAGAAVLIYEKWEPIKRFFEGLFKAIVDGIRKVTALLPSMPSWLKDLGAHTQSLNSLLAPPVPTVGSRYLEGGKARHEVGGRIVMRFENAPTGLRVQSAKSDNPNVSYDLNLGLAMGAL